MIVVFEHLQTWFQHLPGSWTLLIWSDIKFDDIFQNASHKKNVKYPSTSGEEWITLLFSNIVNGENKAPD